jgi:hypothetical protein
LILNIDIDLDRNRLIGRTGLIEMFICVSMHISSRFVMSICISLTGITAVVTISIAINNAITICKNINVDIHIDIDINSLQFIDCLIILVGRQASSVH